MKYLIVNGAEFVSIINKDKTLKVDYSSYSSGTYEDFIFLSPEDLISDLDIFVLCVKEKTNEILGVIKSKRFAVHNHRFVSEDEVYNSDGSFKDILEGPPKNYIAIKYIDVREGYKKRGIAKEMIKILCEKIDLEPFWTPRFRLSFLTEEGSKARLDKIFKSYVPKGIVSVQKSRFF